MTADHSTAEAEAPRTAPGDRTERFLDAALELVLRSPDKDFTVQEVVKESGQSLRSFYQYFNGKHELLLALFAKSARSTADRLREATADEPDGAAQLRRFMLEYHRLCRRRPAAAHRNGDGDADEKDLALVHAELAHRLLTGHPGEAARAFAPVPLLLEEILRRAMAEGAVRPGLDHRLAAGLILQTLMFRPLARTLGGNPHDTGEEDVEALLDLLVRGVAA
jgi:AcrR family transcriptional regulator